MLTQKSSIGSDSIITAKIKPVKKQKIAGTRKSDKPCITYRFRAYPTKEQESVLIQTFGCCRFLWNRYIDDGSFFYKTMGTSLNNTAADYKEDYPFLSDVDSYALCNVQLHYQRAMKAFFNGTSNYPHFKKKGRCTDSYTTNFSHNNIQLNGSFLKLPKLPGKLHICKNRTIDPGLKLKSVTITREPDGAYYVSILYEELATATPIPFKDINPVRVIGLDMSLPDFFVSSNGTEAPCMKYFRKSQDKLAKEQRKLSRMKFGSKNYLRQKEKVARIHADIKHQRKDMLHKLSSFLVRNYDVICIEDLNMQAMAKSLNFGKSVYDNGWSMFVNMLEYKCRRAGKYLVKIDRWFPSSQTCSACGFKNKEVKDLSIREWVCPECGTHHLRDRNAAINIRMEGLNMLFLSETTKNVA